MRDTPAWASTACVAIAACWIIASPAHATDPMSWRRLSSSAPIPPAFGPSVCVYDAPRRRVLAVEVDFRVLQPVVVHSFEVDPSPHWSTLEVSGTAPNQRNLASLVLDPLRDRLLLVGSYPGQDVDVWALPLSGAPTWERLATQGNPPSARSGHSTIYDPVQDRVILFGGGGAPYLSDVWELSLSTNTWTPLYPSGDRPHGREGHGALYDPVRQRMLVFGGHSEQDGARSFWNDLWAFSLGDTPTWSEIQVAGPIPGARSAFGTIYDPVRRRMLIHGGVNAESGVEPDDLWALALDGTPTWTEIVTANRLRGRSYPLDAYDPVEDRFLACGGAGYPQISALSLATSNHWDALSPTYPLTTPGARYGHAVLHDTRRDRFLVIGGGFSTVDSAMWTFAPESASPWDPLASPGAPGVGSPVEYLQVALYDSLGDRIIVFDGWQTWCAPADSPKVWTPFGPRTPDQEPGVSKGAGLAIDSRRNRLLVTGGWVPYPHAGDYTVAGVRALSLGSDPAWSLLGIMPLPWGSAMHGSFYDRQRDRLILLGGFQEDDGPRSTRYFGARVWATPVESTLQWTELASPNDATLPAPPRAYAAFDPDLGRLFVARDSLVWTRDVDDTAPWTNVEFANPAPLMRSAVVYDPIRDQLLALFASTPGSDQVQAWAVAVGPLSVALVDATRRAEAVELTWRSITAFGRAVTLERREEDSDWMILGPITFDSRGLATVTDYDVRAGYDYSYRLGVSDGGSTWHSEPVFVADTSLRLALFGARPNPSVGRIHLAFSLPGTGPARLEIFDLNGRLRLSQDVGAMGPGRHSIVLQGSEAWPSGVYYSRLQRAGETLTTRMVLVR